ncbi:neutral zinc metallopeptidase [Mycobacteroides abscessus]|uniref:hypothetical protein n=2 Tax=Mycobacteroides abscessus TaxID=36809 RepID=UPI0009266B2F|nr:hypothetical protein [Mycobacteroides abscessus]SHP99021.1 putative metalloprotease [Mycobacteroides abscessus subsp. abscessus]SHQ61605.1 putative metalloprotease [Mycobacteroides abscessus subsp. abscessus]SKD62871.1 putative metalloprotease [Mycobacteroides abscessus subsp. abscessus]SLD63271.1 putative metalloprotease [Mycobacteroides abscessus subsp. abscessus]
MNARRISIAVTTGLVTAALVLSGCASTTAGTATSDTTAPPTTSTATTTTAPTTTTRTTTAPRPTDPLTNDVVRALTDADAYWESTLGQRITVDVEAFDSRAGERPTCGGVPYGRAGYCAMKSGNDKIRWDRAAFEPMQRDGDDVAVAIAAAHEYGHAVQDVMGLPQAELQADCLSGVFIGAKGKRFDGSPQAAMNAVFGDDGARKAAFVKGLEGVTASDPLAYCVAAYPA